VRWENKYTCRWPILLVISTPKIFVNGQFYFNLSSTMWSHVFLEHSVFTAESSNGMRPQPGYISAHAYCAYRGMGFYSISLGVSKCESCSTGHDCSGEGQLRLKNYVNPANVIKCFRDLFLQQTQVPGLPVSRLPAKYITEKIHHLDTADAQTY